MSIVIIKCPRLGSFVSTGVEVEPAEFRQLGPKIFRMRCSVCGSEHLWSQATAWLSEAKTIKAAPCGGAGSGGGGGSGN